jgi:hypothetical protein
LWSNSQSKTFFLGCDKCLAVKGRLNWRPLSFIGKSPPVHAGGFCFGRTGLGSTGAILLFLLFAFMKAFQDRRAPWYQRRLIRKPLRKIGMILLHDVERCSVGEIAMVLGK